MEARSRLMVATGLKQRFFLHGRPHVLFEDLSFSMAQGGRLAILGRNGQGKSTLIKILGGVLAPTAGSVHWDTISSWPLGFGGAFQGSLTGMDNILFISRIYRKPAAEIIRRTEEFAELGAALTQEVRYYSTGMRARLGFGLSLAIDFDCYLIDEVIAVGDARFGQKCEDELFGKRADKAFIVATHDFNFVRAKCDRALVIESGQATLYSNVDEAIEHASGLLHRESA
jgi:capsular polysaccharide transport system ATP-binding protein